MKSKIFTLFTAFMLLFGANVMAQELTGGEFIVNGVKYNGDAETQTASVIGVEEGFAQTEVNIPETVNGFTVTSIEARAFVKNNTITNVILPNTLTSIGNYAFRGCEVLKEVALSSTLESVGEHAFKGCLNLNAISIPNSVKTIGDMAFSECTSLKSVVLSQSLEVLADGLFHECSSLENIDIPNSVKRIGRFAFDGTSLKSIYIPASVVDIAYTIIYPQFSGISSIESIVVDENNSVYDSRENCNAIIETASNKLMVGCVNTIIPNTIEKIGSCAFFDLKNLKNLAIPESVQSIDEMAFYQSGLVSITIPESVTTMGVNVFQDCNELYQVVLPNSWTSIPKSLFDSCEKLTEVNIPNNVEVIGDRSFRRCGLIEVEFPASVKTIGESAFLGCENLKIISLPSGLTSIGAKAFRSCSMLQTVVSNIEEPFEISSDVFDVVLVEDGGVVGIEFTTATLYVPKGSKELYKSTAGWNQFAAILEEGETPEHTPITAISELKNTVLYAVSQPHHSKGATSWAVQEGGQALKSSNDLALEVDGTDARQQFAFVSNDGGTTLYLYHAAEAKFVAKDGSLVDKPVDAIQFKGGAYDNTFVAYFDGAHYINVGGSSQMIIDAWSTADGGNSCVITPVGEFDPTEALALIKAFETGVEMTTDNGQQTTVIYDLQGRRVEKVVKGIYIINGKKVVIK